MRGIDLKTILTRIARAADNHITNRFYGIECQLCTGQTKYGLNDMLRLGTLYSYLTIIVTAVLQVDFEVLSMLLHPRPILIYISSVDDKEEIVLAHFIYQQVVDGSAILIAHHAIKDFTHGSTCDIVGEDILYITFGIRTFDRHFAHVGDVKQSYMLTHSDMLWSNASLLIKQRHVESPEGHHGGTQ